MALPLMEDVQVKGFLVHTITYSAATSACEKGGQWQQALHLILTSGLRKRSLQPGGLGGGRSGKPARA